ncbi:MAG: prepilin-type N-terminal cleavage/methylation domain-containing protein [Phycisphaerales bacterium]|nr:prepilin-type N-terminal cleavage/methylation domain-containing protein [Phycisphaerales bacterium]
MALRAAFSLPELMIALVILALGLLIIAAALPVGLSYTQESVNLSNAEVAGEYALDTIEQYLQLWELGATVTYNLDTMNPIFRPNDGTNYLPNYEPLVKVRPMVISNLEPRRSGGAYTAVYDTEGEKLITNWLSRYSITPNNSLEIDYRLFAGAITDAEVALSIVSRAYPPLQNPQRRFPADWLSNPSGWYNSPAVSNAELVQAVTRQVLWTAFYRRVSYDQPGADATPGTADDIAGDPHLYEIIVVVVRRPSERHRFALQKIPSSFDDPAAENVATPSGLDRVAPVPWLVSFDSSRSDALPRPAIMTYTGTGENPRIPDPNVAPRAQLIFKCKPAVGRLLPIGSVFIPARNDVMPNHFQPLLPQNAGFAPYDPHALPIFTVTERPDDTTIVVDNNGVYPWLALAAGAPDDNAIAWPIWVIPPAHVERDSANNPIFDSRTCVIGVSRRYVRLPQFDAP